MLSETVLFGPTIAINEAETFGITKLFSSKQFGGLKFNGLVGSRAG